MRSFKIVSLPAETKYEHVSVKLKFNFWLFINLQMAALFISWVLSRIYVKHESIYESAQIKLKKNFEGILKLFNCLSWQYTLGTMLSE